MQRSYFLLIALTAMLVGCTPTASARSEGIRVVDEDEPSVQASEKWEAIAKDSPADCPVTVPQNPPFTPPPPYSDLGFEGEFWYGSDSLWTRVPQNGIWFALPHNPDGYTQKIFWWSKLFSLKDKLQPALVLFGERLDAEAPALKVSGATHA